MRTISAALAALTLTIGVAAPALAHPRVMPLPPLTVDLTHESTDNIAFVARFHEHFGTAGGTLASNDWRDGEEFYVVTDPRGVFTYDISDPRSPVLLDMLQIEQGTAGTSQTTQEDPSTDGRILLKDGAASTGGASDLRIVSLEDPENLVILGTFDGTDHTWTCVTDIGDPDDPSDDNGCAYAYGRSNNILDLRDPANPVKVATGWKEAVDYGTGNGGEDYTHDLTEIRPGLVMSAGAQPVLMDTTDPANPVPLVKILLDSDDHDSPNDDLYEDERTWSTFGYHSVEWPRGGEDAFILMGTEIGSTGSDCTGDEAIIESWDARPVIAALAEYEAMIADGVTREDARRAVFGRDAEKVDFVRLDSYQAAERGIFLTGQALASEGFCAHWMEHERDFEDGGRIAVGYYNRGVRFVEVDANGLMSEVGWFVGAEADTGSAQWVTDKVVYVHDYRRGLDIVEITEDAATGTYHGTGSVSEAAMTVAEMERIGLLPEQESAMSPVPFVIAAGLAGAAAVRRRRTA